MDPLFLLSALAFLVFLAFAGLQVYKLFLRESGMNLTLADLERRRREAEQAAADAKARPALQAGLRRRLGAAATTRDELTDDSDASLSDGGEQKQPEKMGKKKLAKLQAKADRRAQREAEEAEREQRKKRAAERAERERLKAQREEEEEQRRELEEKRRIEAEKRRQHEEYMKMKSAFEVEDEGCEALDPVQAEALYKQFIEYIRQNKVVSMEQLAGVSGLRTADVIDRLKTLVDNGSITGVFDDRGKFIYITDDEMAAIANFIKQRGRVSVDELAEYSNSLISLDPSEPVLEVK